MLAAGLTVRGRADAAAAVGGVCEDVTAVDRKL